MLFDSEDDSLGPIDFAAACTNDSLSAVSSSRILKNDAKRQLKTLRGIVCAAEACAAGDDRFRPSRRWKRLSVESVDKLIEKLASEHYDWHLSSSPASPFALTQSAASHLGSSVKKCLQQGVNSRDAKSEAREAVMRSVASIECVVASRPGSLSLGDKELREMYRTHRDSPRSPKGRNVLLDTARALALTLSVSSSQPALASPNLSKQKWVAQVEAAESCSQDIWERRVALELQIGEAKRALNKHNASCDQYLGRIDDEICSLLAESDQSSYRKQREAVFAARQASRKKQHRQLIGYTGGIFSHSSVAECSRIRLPVKKIDASAYAEERDRTSRLLELTAAKLEANRRRDALSQRLGVLQDQYYSCLATS